MTTISPSLSVIVETGVANSANGVMNDSDISRILAKLSNDAGKDAVNFAELNEINRTIDTLVQQGRISQTQGKAMQDQIKGSLNKALENGQMYASKQAAEWAGFQGVDDAMAVRQMANRAAADDDRHGIFGLFRRKSITSNEVEGMLKVAAQDGSISLNEINAMYSGINDAFNRGDLSMQQRNQLTQQLEAQLKQKTGARKGACGRRIKGPYADKLTPEAKDFIQNQLGGKMSRGAKGWTKFTFDRQRIRSYVGAITKDGTVSPAERTALMNHLLRDGKVTFDELQTVRQSLSWAMWNRDITPQEYNRTIKMFDLQIAQMTGGVQASSLQQSLALQQQGMFMIPG